MAQQDLTPDTSTPSLSQLLPPAAREHVSGDTALSSHDMTIVINKLDADVYNAQDYDAVTENLFGSGNLNHAALQSRQVDAALDGASSQRALQPDTGLNDRDQSYAAAPVISEENASQQTIAPAGGIADSSAADIRRTPATQTTQTTSAQSVSTRETSNSNFTDETRTETALNGSNGTMGVNGTNGTDGRDGADGTAGPGGNDGTDGTDGMDGTDGNGGQDGTTIFYTVINNNNSSSSSSVTNNYTYTYNTENNTTVNNGDITFAPVIENIVNVTTGDILSNINLGDINLGDVHLGDINLGDINLGDITIDLGDLLPILGGGGDNDPNDVDLHIGNSLGLPEINVNLDLVESIIGDIDISIVQDLTNGVLSLDLDALALGSELLDTVIPVDLSALESLTDTVENLAGNLIDNLLNGGESDPDADLSIVTDLLPLDLHIPLDPVEALIGDIDIDIVQSLTEDGALNLDVGAVVAGLDVLNETIPLDLSPVTDIADTLGELAQNILPGLGQPGGSGDTDLSLTMDLLPIDIQVSLDPVEALLGDIDISIDEALSSGNPLATVDAFLLNTDVLDVDLGDMSGGLIPSLADTVQSTLENIVSGGIGLDIGTAPETGDPTDLVLGLADQTILSETLDSLESLVGDIDLNLDILTDPQNLADSILGMLDDAQCGTLVEDLNALVQLDVFSTLGDVTGDTASWPQSPIADTAVAGIGSVTDTVTDLISDPVGNLSEGLGAITSGIGLGLGNTGTPPSHGGGGFGGFLGGLFG